MELMDGMLWGALPLIFLCAAVGLAIAYDRLNVHHSKAERQHASTLDILENCNDALFVIDFANGQLLQVNQKACELLGQPKEALLARTIFDLHPPELLHLSALRMAEAWENKGTICEDLTMIHASGEPIALGSSMKVATHGGRPAIVLFARDIRARLTLQCEVEAQQALVREKNTELLASIRYAKRIQGAVLPSAEQLEEMVPESFILYRPRDIVSGDLYWFGRVADRCIIAAADCTGHGVPGALLSLIGASLFQEAVLSRGITDPASILASAREGMITTLSQTDGSEDQQDGMDGSVISLSADHSELDYAGALSSLYLIRHGELVEHKGDRMTIGTGSRSDQPFTSLRIPLLKGDRFYVFSDGLQDQFGGPKGKKLGSKRLKEWLLETAAYSIEEQHQAISDRFRMWKGGLDQVDDVLLIGGQV